MVPILVDKILDHTLEKLPRFLVRKFVKIEQIQENLEVALASPAPLTLHLKSTFAPQAEIILRITNKNAIPITIDRILFEIWLGQPFLQSAQLRRFTLKPKETNDYLYSRFYLNEVQRAAIGSESDEKAQQRNGFYRIELTAYCDCKAGQFEIRKNFQVDRETVPSH